MSLKQDAIRNYYNSSLYYALPFTSKKALGIYLKDLAYIRWSYSIVDSSDEIRYTFRRDIWVVVREQDTVYAPSLNSDLGYWDRK